MAIDRAMSVACGTVNSKVDYLKKLPIYKTEKPFQLFIPIDKEAPDQRTSNLEFESKECTFTDIRDRAYDCTLDNDGFQFHDFPTKLEWSSFKDRVLVESQYFPEIELILKRIEGGYDRLFIFDWRIRDSSTPRAGNEFDMNDPTTWLRPSPAVHVDQSDRAVLHRIRLHLPDEMPFLLQGRVRIINVWRPLEHAVEDYPLAFCDPDTMPAKDLTECDHVRRKFKGANLYAHHNDEHQWYYMGNQHPDEVLLMKMFDSDTSVNATKLAHASFHHPSATAYSRARKSIEVRALVFNYPETQSGG